MCGRRVRSQEREAGSIQLRASSSWKRARSTALERAIIRLGGAGEGGYERMAPMRRLAFISALLALVAAASLTAAAQYGQRRWFRGPVDIPVDPPPPFDGRFTFARLKFTTGPGGYYFRGLPAWAHGYVGGGEGRRSERNLAKILNSITNMNPHVDATRVVDVGDPDLCEYPIVYATEAGFMQLDDREAHAFGDYLKKGGFVIFDDFRGP